MSYVQIWIHAVWGTKRRELVLTDNIILSLCDHISANAKQKEFYIVELNGVADHLHCLMALKSDWSIGKQMQMIKGESANWLNKSGLITAKFEWADEYFAASVSRDKLDIVRSYIQNQKEHHRRITFKEEYENFLEKFGFNQG